jgi:hypothetical protein
MSIGRPWLARELPTKRRSAEVAVAPLAAPMPSAGTILIKKLIVACIAAADGIARRQRARLWLRAY